MTEELPDPGEVPALDWIDKTLITVDPLYQRPLDTERAATIARGFTWRSFGALVVVPSGEGYHVTDGQHRLEAAKLHPKITHVPAVIVQADTIGMEAGIFVHINKNRKNVTSLELFFAQLTAGDDDAETIRQVCDRAGVRIPKYASGSFRPRDTIAIAAIQAVIGRHGAQRAREYLQILAAADLAPIRADQIKAVEHLMHDPEFRGHVALADLGEVIKTVGAMADVDARRFAATYCCPFWKGLASTWFQKCKKQRQPAKVVQPALQAEPARQSVVQTASRPMVRPDIAARAAEMVARNAPLPRQNVTSSVLGDPVPGRSALDQRKASA